MKKDIRGGRIWVGYRFKDGLYYVQYSDKNGQSTLAKAKTLKNAMTEAKRFGRDYDRGRLLRARLKKIY